MARVQKNVPVGFSTIRGAVGSMRFAKCGANQRIRSQNSKALSLLFDGRMSSELEGR